MNLQLLIPPTASPRPQSRGQSLAFGGSASRAGNAGGASETNVNQMFKDRFSSVNTAKNQIEKQREFDAAKARLKQEFDQIDYN